MKQFLDADKNNPLMATVVGKRKREVGLVIPAKYSAMTANQEIITVLNNELLKRKEKCKHFKMKFESVTTTRRKLSSTKYSFLNIQINPPFSSGFILK